MEKRRPHYALELVRKLASDPACTRFTQMALNGAAELGYSTADMRRVIMGLERKDFYKSMTTHLDTSVWQDVYRPVTGGARLYVKVTVYPEGRLLVVSFKRR